MRNLKLLVVFYLLLLVSGCRQAGEKSVQETILRGETTILVDESLKPVVEDLVQIFEHKYDATIHIVAKSEAEVIRDLAQDTSRIAIISRKLNPEEMNFFKTKKIYPKTTPFAKDAIALISSRNTKDTLISLQDISAVLQGNPEKKVNRLVFDNLNSGTVRHIKELLGIKEISSEQVFSFQTNEDVINYVAQNDGVIGVVGINYIFEPSEKTRSSIDNIQVLNVLNTSDDRYYSPTQNNLGEGTYPLARELYVVNAQGYDGLGMGFASFIAGEIGQRIILKSGLLPVKVPPRIIRVRKTIEKEKN